MGDMIEGRLSDTFKFNIGELVIVPGKEGHKDILHVGRIADRQYLAHPLDHTVSVANYTINVHSDIKTIFGFHVVGAPKKPVLSFLRNEDLRLFTDFRQLRRTKPSLDERNLGIPDGLKSGPGGGMIG